MCLWLGYNQQVFPSFVIGQEMKFIIALINDKMLLKWIGNSWWLQRKLKTFCDKWNCFHSNNVSISFSCLGWLQRDRPPTKIIISLYVKLRQRSYEFWCHITPDQEISVFFMHIWQKPVYYVKRIPLKKFKLPYLNKACDNILTIVS